MIKVNGKVPYDTPSNGSVSLMEDCIDDCYSKPDCILAYMDSNSHCLLYNYSNTLIINVTETTIDEGFYVAFKVESTSETCPSTVEEIDFCGSIGSETYCWNKTTTGWVLTNLCPDPWKVFERNNSVTVCLRAFNYSQGISKSKAMSACENQGYKLTGVASDEESIWMKGVLEFKKPGFWLDGSRSKECLPNLCNKYDWSDGYTVGSAALNSSYAFMTYSFGGKKEDCLEVYTGDNYTLNDCDCGTRHFGYFCGFRMFNR